jgi:hypothetical protein
MKIILEPTSKMTAVNGTPVRIWEGVSDAGIPCFALIAIVGVDKDEDSTAFDESLKEVKAPTGMTDWIGRDIIFEAETDG